MRGNQALKVALALVAVGLSLAGCGSDDSDDGGDDGTGGNGTADGGVVADLDGRTFLSTAVREDGADRPLVAGTRISLTFDDGTIGASAGCNQIGGDYELDGDVLVVDAMSTTEMGCDPERHEQDTWVVELLTSRPTLTLAENELTVTGGAIEVVLLDREVADPDRPIVGAVWTVDTLIDGEVASNVPEGVTATLEFAADGRVDIFTGCNAGGARAEVGEGVVVFSEPRFEQIACTGGAAEVEEAVFAVVKAGTVAYEIEAGVLRLDADGRGLGLHA